MPAAASPLATSVTSRANWAAVTSDQESPVHRLNSTRSGRWVACWRIESVRFASSATVIVAGVEYSRTWYLISRRSYRSLTGRLLRNLAHPPYPARRPGGRYRSPRATARHDRRDLRGGRAGRPGRRAARPGALPALVARAGAFGVRRPRCPGRAMERHRCADRQHGGLAGAVRRRCDPALLPAGQPRWRAVPVGPPGGCRGPP